jgi:hypothetical protein
MRVLFVALRVKRVKLALLDQRGTQVPTQPFRDRKAIQAQRVLPDQKAIRALLAQLAHKVKLDLLALLVLRVLRVLTQQSPDLLVRRVLLVLRAKRVLLDLKAPLAMLRRQYLLV